MTRATIVDELLRSPEPSLRWKIRTKVLFEEEGSAAIVGLREEIRRSRRARALLARFRRPSTAADPKDVYSKWRGEHWVLASLADLGYPPGDPELAPLAERVARHWLAASYFREFDATGRTGKLTREGVPRIQGRYRRCASTQGNALRFLVALGLEEDRTPELVERLLHWQWPDGGWNCDTYPGADNSSFMETRWPMVGLALYGRRMRSATARKASEAAAEVFLRRRLFRRETNGAVIHPDFCRLHYPLYWHYDFLGGLSSVGDVGRLGDRRCREALDLLESRRLPDGGWPADRRYYRTPGEGGSSGTDYVDWGGTSARSRNDWVTAEALGVLARAGRLDL